MSQAQTLPANGIETKRNRPLVVVAVGGNSLIGDPSRISEHDQAEAAGQSMGYVAAIIQQGWDVVVTHGNGPQVGHHLRRAELAVDELPALPLDVIDACTQGVIGYHFTRSLHNHFRAMRLDARAVAVCTQTVVAADDPAFQRPSKPIGRFMSEEAARVHERDDGWSIVEDSGRGWRRVVPSPTPRRVVELPAIKALLAAGYTVVASGGGGVPVTESRDGFLGSEAVIDKDSSSALLANQLEADLLLISTSVEAVAINFNTPEEKWLSKITVAEARRYLAEGQFGEGSMAPKISAAICFVENGGAMAVITRPEFIVDALHGAAGTAIVP